MPKLPVRRRLVLLAAAFASVVALPASASASPFSKGPDPTAEVVAQASGPYGVTTYKIANSASPAFGPATVYAPEAPAGETFGGVAVSPGFLAEQWTLQWLAKRLASQGFVTIVFTPNSVFAQPVARSRALFGALDYLKTASPAKALVDPDRLAVVGHSMGGGGALEAVRRDTTLKAAVAIAPWSQWKSFDAATSPTLILGFKPDNIAPIATHAKRFFRSLTPSQTKGYLELNIQHATPSLVPVTDVSRATTNWLKRFVDDDERYTKTLCPLITGVKSTTVTGYQSTCGAGPLAATP